MKDWRKLFDLSGRVALVIGAGSGIGQPSAQGLAAFGAKCVVADLSADAADATARSILDAGGVAEAAAVDVRSTQDVNEQLRNCYTLICRCRLDRHRWEICSPAR